LSPEILPCFALMDMLVSNKTFISCSTFVTCYLTLICIDERPLSPIEPIFPVEPLTPEILPCSVLMDGPLTPI
jgi:hypothetical protein